MITLLSDKNCEGHTRELYHVLIREGWTALLDIRLATFKDVDLNDGDDSLEMVTQRLLTVSTLPVLTIGKLEKVMRDTHYRDACAETIALVIFELHKFRGIPRLFIPF